MPSRATIGSQPELRCRSSAIAVLKARNPAWIPVVERAGMAAWTDDYSTILPLLKGLW